MTDYFATVGIVINFIVILFILLFAINVILKYVIKIKTEPVVDEADMPKLRPLPIPTKNKSYFGRILAWLFDIRQWELVDNWNFKIQGDREEPVEIVIHKGFKFDGASIPRPLWALLSPVGLLLIPGLIHDYAYVYNQLWEKVNGEIIPYKVQAGKRYWDTLFRNVGENVNGFTVINYIAWLGIKIFGIFAWNKRREDNAKIIKPDI